MKKFYVFSASIEDFEQVFIAFFKRPSGNDLNMIRQSVISNSFTV